MELKHTPGPWKVREVSHSNVPGKTAYAIEFNDDREQVVDWVYEKADAVLISEAPALLEALQGAEFLIRVHAENSGSASDLAAADYYAEVLARATGACEVLRC